MTLREELIMRAERVQVAAKAAELACLDTLALLKQMEAKND